jgi:hypothetical protein
VFETGYYRILKSADSDYSRGKGFVEGELAYVLAGPDDLTVLIHGSTWTYPYDKPESLAGFAESFEFEPNGAQIRQAEIAALMQEISNVDSVTATMQSQLSHFNPCVSEETGEVSETGSELAPVADMGTIKRMVATNRNTLVKVQKDVKNKTNQLKRLMEEQSSILELKTKELTALLSKAEEAIWSINLYMGKNEEIHVLRTGIPAPAEQKIVLRQQVLFMDEECAIAARSEGIDIQSIDQFDKWLLENPANLSRVLYETKAIVALHVKRHTKKYGDQYTDHSMNKANLTWTYFLIRNGENLYRVFIDLDAGQYMFPTTDSLTNLFHHAKPGSREYMQAMKAAEESHRHYLRVLLVLQGLLDRTPIFKPMPVSRINLCDPGQSYDYVEFIYDAERQLTDGRVLFDEWLENANEQLEVGHRIMGTFDYRSGISGSKDNGTDSRITPSRADRPGSNILHTIDKEEDGRFSFKYERRGETIYDRYGRGREPKNRASCWVEKDDNFFLNFDAVELKDLEYYATHRQSRHLYKDMITLLEESIKLKKKETADEEPFRKLLVGQMMKHYSVSLERAEELVPDLIRWWKFKNREHRALLSKDNLALNMIVQEFGLRLRNATESQGMDQAVLNAALPLNPLMVARKRDNIYVIYLPHNDGNIWVREEEWKFNRSRGVLNMESEDDWQVVDKRHWRWEVLHKSDRWKDWRINPFKNKVLTDPEIEEVKTQALEQLQKNYKDGDGFLPLAVTCNTEDFSVRVWYSDRRLEVPALLHSENITEANLKSYTPSWTKKNKEVKIEKYYSYSGSTTYRLNDQSMSWEDKDHSRVLQTWPENIEVVKDEVHGEKAAKAQKKEVERRYDYVTKSLRDQIYNEKVSEAKHEFFLEHGDPELWDDHLASLKITKPSFGILDEALRLHSERDVNPIGQTVAQVLAQARQWGMGSNKKMNYYDSSDYNHVPTNLPMDWVILSQPEPESEED